MGIYVKGMGMPQDCWECPLLRIRYGIFDHQCGVTRIALQDHMFGRMGSCPLVEIKVPHGDLIDRDKIDSQDIGPDGFSVYGSTAAMINLEPAVIESENEASLDKTIDHGEEHERPYCELWRDGNFLYFRDGSRRCVG